jgi:hypothetical protein
MIRYSSFAVFLWIIGYDNQYRYLLHIIVHLGPVSRDKRTLGSEKPMILLYPPLTKPGEPPAAPAYLAASLRAHGVRCTFCDLNLEGLHFLLLHPPDSTDTWTRRAVKGVSDNLTRLRSPQGYDNFSRYSRAVADLNRLVAMSGQPRGLRLTLADYQDHHLSPLASSDLERAAAEYENNIFSPLFSTRLEQLCSEDSDPLIGISLCYLSQALCAFAIIGYLRAHHPERRIVLGGGLISTWLGRPHEDRLFAGLVDHLVAGPGQAPLLKILGRTPQHEHLLPDYSDLRHSPYLSPGFILPYTTSFGCYWKKCSFCPETTENRRFQPLPPQVAASDLKVLATTHRPTLIHLLDNALSPAMLRALMSQPPGAPWYGFVRLERQLTDLQFCHDLRRSGCVMLKLGLESASQAVLDAMGKGTRLDQATTILNNLKEAGIASYVYLLFGTPTEDHQRAEETRLFVERHQESITFLNLAIFNLPVGSTPAADLSLSDFYPGDLSIYRDFRHPLGWERGTVRRYLDTVFKRSPPIGAILRRDPPLFTSNHAAFFRAETD